MGKPLYPDQPHRTLGEKKEEPVAESKVETTVIDEAVKTTIVAEPKTKPKKKFNLKNLGKKKEK